MFLNMMDTVPLPSVLETWMYGGDQVAIIKGKHYRFSNIMAKYLFMILPGRIKMATDNWNSRSSSSLNES